MRNSRIWGKNSLENPQRGYEIAILGVFKAQLDTPPSTFIMFDYKTYRAPFQLKLGARILAYSKVLPLRRKLTPVN